MSLASLAPNTSALPRGECGLHEWFERQADQTPAATAVWEDGRQISYAELEQRANQVAHHLHRQGLGPDDLVGVCLPRSVDLLAALLGILKVGAAYLPLAPSLPPERLALLLREAQPRFLIGGAETNALLPAHSLPRLDIASSARLQEESASRLNLKVSSHHLAYAIFTSGTTGTPKLVGVEHASISNLLAFATQSLFQAEDVRLTPFLDGIGGDSSIHQIFVPLSVGGALVVISGEGGTLALSGLKQPITYLGTTPSGLRMLFDMGGLPVSVRCVGLGAEVIPTQLLAELCAWKHVERVFNFYGPTETTIYCTVARLFERNGATTTAGTGDVPAGRIIGEPIANTRAYIVDEQGREVAAGAAGELWVAGECVARGYLNAPAATAARFGVDPFAANGTRLYRTGDRVRRLPAGGFEFLGRLDDQVKIRGFRVELGEVEAALWVQPGIKEAAVVMRSGRADNAELAAFLVSQPDAQLQLESLRAGLEHSLPEHMIPQTFIVVQQLPLTVSGKVDRKALLDLSGVGLAREAAYCPPRTETERELVEIWEAAFSVPKVGVWDDFLALGGHSLLATVIAARIQRQLGRKMPGNWMFDYPTVAGLAEWLGREGGCVFEHSAVEKADRKSPLPASFGQEQMWLLQLSVPDPATYNLPLALRLSPRTDRERMRRTLQSIMDRHDVLRTSILQRGEDVVQQVAAAGTVDLPWAETDQTAMGVAGNEKASAEFLTNWARQPFQMEVAPLWRALWISQRGDQILLALNFHHAVMDEWSLRIFLRELERIYAAGGDVKGAGLPALRIQYADFAVWQRRQVAGGRGEEQRKFWREELRDLPAALELPADKTRAGLPTGEGGIFEAQITGPAVERLRVLARGEATTLFHVALAAFQVWLYRHTLEPDILVGTPVSLREQVETQDLLGYFLNILPIRARLDGRQTFLDVVRRTRKTLLAGLSNGKFPFREMVEVASEKGGLRDRSLFRVMFVLLEEGLPTAVLEESPVGFVPVTSRTSKYDLILHILVQGETWHCQWEFAADLFSPARVQALAGHWEELLTAIADNPLAAIGQLNILREAERRQILVEWNRTARPYPRDRCIHELFAEQAERAPGAVAVVCGARSLGYGELERQASRLAGHLRALGLGDSRVVGLSGERSLEMVVALLAILKAGGAYWGVEEHVPEHRLRSMLKDASPTLLLVRKEAAARWAALLSQGGTRVAVLEDLLAAPAPGDNDILPGCGPQDPAYLSFTSGSTGGPKGVLVPHRAVVRLVKEADYVSLGAQEVLLHHSPLSFDASTFELWGPLLNGGKVVLAAPGQATPAELGVVIRDQGITTLWLTAGLFHLMVDENLTGLRPLRQLLAGGDVLSPTHMRKARRGLPGCRIINGYGPTENTTFTCCHTVVEDGWGDAGVPLGRPIANTQIYILDSFGQPVPPGVPGELHAGGDGLACGYLKQPQLTAERFIADRFSPTGEGTLYRTGDLARWREDGVVEFLGRADQQVKIRGYRIELVEVEDALAAHPEVAAAVVVAVPGESEKTLAAYLVRRKEPPPANETLRQWLAGRLPTYMVPSVFVWLDHLPLTANGKVDRNGLPTASTATDLATGRPNALPVNLLELELVRIWERLFRRKNVQRHDNFFTLGGHSLLAARLAAEIDKLLGAKISIAALFQSPTVASLAERLARQDWTPAWSSLVPLQPAGSRKPLFFVHGWGGDVYNFLDLARALGPDQPSYGVQAVGLDGKSPRHTNVADMVAHYVREITAFQPQGSIQLAGYSMGGIMAYEVARQLLASGRRVGMLLLLDTTPVGPVPWIFRAYHQLLHRYWFHFRRWCHMPVPEKRAFLGRRWATVRGFFNRMLGNPPLPPTPVTAPAVASAPDPTDYYHDIVRRQPLRPYAGAADVFVSDEFEAGWRFYWRYLVRRRLKFHRVPGKHLEIFSEKNLPVLVKSLKVVLEDAHLKNTRRRSADGHRNAHNVS